MISTLNNAAPACMDSDSRATASRVEMPPRRDVGRFRETSAIRNARRAVSVLCRLSPLLASHLAYSVLARPPRGAERPWQAKLRHTARVAHLRVHARQIPVYSWGSGPTVLMVHGWGGRATHMGKLIEPLVQAGFRVVSFDAPAHGASEGRKTDPIQFATAVRAVAQHVGPIHTLIAHSFGVAAALIARRDGGVDAKQQIYISSLNHCIWFTEVFAQYLGLTPEVIDRARQMMERRYNHTFSWNTLSVVEMLRRTHEPTLLIHDQDDGEIPFSHSVALAQAAPHAQLHMTVGLGHHKLLGDADVIKRVVRFVETTPAKPAIVRGLRAV